MGVTYSGSPYELHQPFAPAGDQPEAIEKLIEGLSDGLAFQTLLGVTGSGKTFTMANVIARTGRPALVLAPNKTLAAQLYSEFREFFPNNAVEYFVSYYDYYQPEAYVPSRDLYIEKDSSINEHIEQMRLSATKAILERPDCVIVATVSAIYGIGDPSEYHSMILHLREGDRLAQRDAIKRLTELQYQRAELDFKRGTFRVRGDVLDIFPAEHAESAVRVSMFDDEIESLTLFDPLTGHPRQRISRFTVFPSSHYVTGRQKVLNAVEAVKAELAQQKEFFVSQMKLIEAQRIEQRTRFDLEMMIEIGFCKGIENYSRHLSGRKPGEPPPTLIDYLPRNTLMIVDESHVTIPQVGGMYKGDRARKENLVNYGFRLPSALDNRPLRFDEFERLLPQTIFVSATPADYEHKHAGQVVEQVVRPTGLVDPVLEVRPARTQVDDLLSEIRIRVGRNERVLVTTLTKRMAEDLTDYLGEHGVKVRYLHSDIDTVERVEIIRDLRLGEFDVLVGINLLREGLDIAGGVAGRHPRCRQGRVPARGAQPDPDDRPRRAAHQRHGHPLRRHDDGFDEGRDRRDRTAPAQAGRVEREDGHHAAGRAEAHQGPDRRRLRRRRGEEGAEGRAGAREVRAHAGEGPRARAQGHREGDAGRRQEPGVRARRRAARPSLPAAREALRRRPADRDLSAAAGGQARRARRRAMVCRRHVTPRIARRAHGGRT